MNANIALFAVASASLLERFFSHVSYRITNGQTLKLCANRVDVISKFSEINSTDLNSFLLHECALVKQVNVYLVEYNFNDQQTKCGIFFLVLSVRINISDKVDGILQWKLFQCIYLCAQMFIYRHLTRTTLIRTFQRSQFTGVVPFRLLLYELHSAQNVHTEELIFSKLFSLHMETDRITHFFSRMKLITTHFATWPETFAVVSPKRSRAENDFCKSFCIRNSHITRTTQVNALACVCVCVYLRVHAGRWLLECEPRKIEKCHAKSFKSFLHSYAITINYCEHTRKKVKIHSAIVRFRLFVWAMVEWWIFYV